MTWFPSDTELKLTSRYTSRYQPKILTHTHAHIHTHTHKTDQYLLRQLCIKGSIFGKVVGSIPLGWKTRL